MSTRPPKLTRAERNVLHAAKMEAKRRSHRGPYRFARKGQILVSADGNRYIPQFARGLTFRDKEQWARERGWASPGRPPQVEPPVSSPKTMPGRPVAVVTGHGATPIAAALAATGLLTQRGSR
jgi:hypothetical protein